jgi:uncharacterized phosphosugar-binding protein
MTETTNSGLLAEPARAFVQAATETIGATVEREAEHLRLGSIWIAEAVRDGGLVRVFGTGHSRLIAEEIFYRAGGLAPIDAVLEDTVSGYRDVTKSEFTERLEGLGELIVRHRRMAPPDVLLVISQSGRNAVPIEVAEAARARGIRTIAITSLLHAAGQPSRHSSGRHLHEVVDLPDQRPAHGSPVGRHGRPAWPDPGDRCGRPAPGLGRGTARIPIGQRRRRPRVE